MATPDKMVKAKRLLIKCACAAPVVSIYLFSRGDMADSAMHFSIVALITLAFLAADSLRGVEHLEKACREAQKRGDEYKAQYEKCHSRMMHMRDVAVRGGDPVNAEMSGDSQQ